MNYKKHYDLLIEKAKNRIVVDGHTEKHHIIPRCVGGSNDKTNLVILTAREHYMAHYLLHKIQPSHRGLLYAIYMMMNLKKSDTTIKISSREYEKIKKLVSIATSKRMMGKKNHFYGKKHTPETLQFISDLNTGRKRTKEQNENQSRLMSKENHPMWKKKHKPSSLKKMSDIKKGKKPSLESIEKQSQSLKKYYQNEEHILKNRILKTCVKIEIDGISYQSIRDASRQLNKSRGKIVYRLKSDNFPNYKYI